MDEITDYALIDLGDGVIIKLPVMLDKQNDLVAEQHCAMHALAKKLGGQFLDFEESSNG